MNKTWHPHPDEHGKPVHIRIPSKPSNNAEVTHADKIATFIPGVQIPVSLNSIELMTWANAPTTLEGWSQVPGQIPIQENPMPAGLKQYAAGVVIEESDERVWVVSPTNGFGGYINTFPKGKADKGLSLQAVAIKECFEESGLQVEIIDVIGDFERSTSTARYYLAKRVGGNPADAGWESQAVHLVPKNMLLTFLNSSSDRTIVQALMNKFPSFYRCME